MALQPASLSSFSRRSQTWIGTAAPNAPASWCRQTPLSFIDWPLSEKPLAGSKVKVRMPKGVSYSSMIASDFLDLSPVAACTMRGIVRRPECGVGELLIFGDSGLLCTRGDGDGCRSSWRGIYGLHR